MRAQRTRDSSFRAMFEKKLKMCPFNSVNMKFSLYVLGVQISVEGLTKDDVTGIKSHQSIL